MGLYERYVLPHVINMSCGAPPILKQREKVVPLATASHRRETRPGSSRSTTGAASEA